jgi:hypothetical protein
MYKNPSQYTTYASPRLPASRKLRANRMLSHERTAWQTIWFSPHVKSDALGIKLSETHGVPLGFRISSSLQRGFVDFHASYVHVWKMLSSERTQSIVWCSQELYIPKKTLRVEAQRTVCPVCKGNKVVKVKGKEKPIPCPRCGGTGYI